MKNRSLYIAAAFTALAGAAAVESVEFLRMRDDIRAVLRENGRNIYNADTPGKRARKAEAINCAATQIALHETASALFGDTDGDRMGNALKSMLACERDEFVLGLFRPPSFSASSSAGSASPTPPGE